jgi:hypothetical protein
MSGTSTLLASGRQIGRLVWTESRLFEVTGHWIATTSEPSARAFLSAASGHHGQRAELLSTLLPAVAGGPTLAELVAPSPDLPDLGELESIAPTTDRVRAVWKQIMVTHIAAAEAHIGATSVLAEAAAHRILGIVITDSRVDVAAADALLAPLAPPR